jgi:hypothetical protein
MPISHGATSIELTQGRDSNLPSITGSKSQAERGEGEWLVEEVGGGFDTDSDSGMGGDKLRRVGIRGLQGREEVYTTLRAVRLIFTHHWSCWTPGRSPRVDNLPSTRDGRPARRAGDRQRRADTRGYVSYLSPPAFSLRW